MKHIIMISLLLVMSACSKDYDHIYTWGECVQMKLTGEQGMVVRKWSNQGLYQVRVAQASKTNSAMFGADNTENQRYALVNFREFELENCD